MAASHLGLANRTIAVVFLGIMLGCSSGEVWSPPVLPDPAVLSEPIVGGQNEAGYPAVGALAIDYQGMWAQYCSGSLIAPEWVLTAAHCVIDTTGDFRRIGGLHPYLVSFFIGPDATSPFGGDVYEAEEFFPHPEFDQWNVYNDIALVRLADPVVGVAPMVYNDIAMSNRLLGQTLLHVGYGVNNGRNDTGSGIKRSGRIVLAEVAQGQYLYEALNGVCPCRGDSGGPGLMSIDGQERIIGVASTVLEETCSTGGVDTRVDSYADWIVETMGGVVEGEGEGEGLEGEGEGAGPDCDIAGGDCGAGQACWPTGAVTFACAPSQGAGLGQNCNADTSTWQAALPCGDGTVCLPVNQNDPTDGRCFALCQGVADCGGSEQCYAPIFQGIANVGVCITEPETNDCAITGGDCGGNQACFPTDRSGGTGCYPSDGIGLEQPCNPNLEDRLACADGLLCAPTNEQRTEGRCFQFCRADRDCDPLDRCYLPIFQSIDDLGVCVCRNLDEDDACMREDCDDNNAAVFPGAPERCDDRIDNDCDGETDEGCAQEGEGEAGEGEGEAGEGEAGEGEAGEGEAGEGGEGEGGEGDGAAEGEGAEGEGEGEGGGGSGLTGGGRTAHLRGSCAMTDSQLSAPSLTRLLFDFLLPARRAR